MADKCTVICSVGELAAPVRNALVGGPFGSDLVSSDYVPSGVPVIRGQNLTKGKYVGGEFVFVSEVKADKLSANLARPGDLVFTQRGNAVLNGGQVAIVPDGRFERYLVSQSQMKLTPDHSKVDPRFLYFVFTSSEHAHYLRSNAIVTGVPHTNLKMLRDYEFPLPPLADQKAIAAVLGALDDKIELNRRMNATLEAMARALFQSWFVDFDPVRAKLDNRQPPGLDEATAALFPSKFQDSPDGDSYNAIALGMPLINGPVEFGDYFPVKTKWSEAATRFADEGDLIFCVRGSTTGRRVVSDGKYGIGRGVCAIRAKGEFHGFLYQTINVGLHRLLEKTTGSVFPSLSSPDIKGFSVLKPSQNVMEAFERTTKTLIRRVQQNHTQSRTLATLRDTLLPKLLSGEIRVGHSASMVPSGV
jgi:type I restriction enzyme S subunit